MKEHSVINTLTESENEVAAIATHQDVAGLSGTRSGKAYLNDYSKVEPNKATEIPAEPIKRKSLASRRIQK